MPHSLHGLKKIVYLLVKTHCWVITISIIIKISKVKVVVRSMVLWHDVHTGCMWWIIIQIGEWWYGPHSELLEIFITTSWSHCGPGSSVIIATGYGLDGPGIETRWRGVRFSSPIQTGPRAHPAICTMGTGSFPGGKNGRGVTLTRRPF